MLAVVLASAGSALAQPGTGLIRIGHLSPTTPGVDVYVGAAADGVPGGAPVATGVVYGAVTGYDRLEAGRYTIAMRPAGAPADSPPPVTANVEVGAGSAQSVLFFDTGPSGTVQGQILADDQTATGPAEGRVRIVQGASDVDPVRVAAVDGPLLADGLVYGAVSDYITVGARTWQIQAAAGALAAETALSVGGGSVSSVVLGRTAEGLTFTPLTDAPGLPATGAVPATAAPQGGVEAGAGGAAEGGGVFPVVVAAFGAVLIVAVVVVRRGQGDTRGRLSRGRGVRR